MLIGYCQWKTGYRQKRSSEHLHCSCLYLWICSCDYSKQVDLHRWISVGSILLLGVAGAYYTLVSDS